MISIEVLTKHVAAAKQQDRDAFTFLFNHTKDYTYSIAYSLTQDTQESQDIVQEVYLRVWMHLSDLQEDRSFLRWLHSITFNISQDHLRQKMNRQNALDSAAEDFWLQKTSFDEWFMQSWKQELIRDMVQALPEEQREAVYLYYFQDRTVGEIAAMQNCPINTVKSRLFYARNTLQKLIEAEEKRTGNLHLPPAVIAMTSVMMLPVMQVSLPHADSVRILMAIFTAAESMRGGISYAQVYPEQENSAHRGFWRRLFSSIETHWIVRIKSSTVVALLAAVILFAAGCIVFGRIMERRTSTVIPNEQITVQPNVAVDAEGVPADTQTAIGQIAPAVLVKGSLGDTVQYTVTDDGVLRISGEGRVGLQDAWRWDALSRLKEDQSIFQLESLGQYRDFITAVIVEEGISEIGYAAFARTPNLETVSLPDSCTRVASGAFYACPALTEMIFPPYVENIEDCVLKACTSLKRVVVSEDARYIGSEAFADCYQLESVEFPGNQLETIGGGVFCNLPALKTLRLPDSVKQIMSGAIQSIGIEILDLSNLKHTDINGSAIRDCFALHTLLLPERMDKVSTSTVYNCTSLTTVILGPETNAIAQKAFSNAALTEITIPASVSSIAGGAFSGQKHLTAVWVDDENPYYCDVDGVLYNRSMDTIHTYPRGRMETSYILPESVSMIAQMAFANNSVLQTIVIPGDIAVLENKAILSMSALTGLYFQSSMPEIWAAEAVTNSPKLVLYCPESTVGISDGTWTAPDGTVFQINVMNFQN